MFLKAVKDAEYRTGNSNGLEQSHDCDHWITESSVHMLFSLQRPAKCTPNTGQNIFFIAFHLMK